MSDLEDSMIEQEIRDGWWGFGEAVMREMTEDDYDKEEIEESEDRSL